MCFDASSHTRTSDSPLGLKEWDARVVSLSPDGRTIAAAHRTTAKADSLKLYVAKILNRIVDIPLAVKESKTTALIFSADGRKIAAARVRTGAMHDILTFDIASRAERTEMPVQVTTPSD